MGPRPRCWQIAWLPTASRVLRLGETSATAGSQIQTAFAMLRRPRKNSAKVRPCVSILSLLTRAVMLHRCIAVMLHPCVSADSCYDAAPMYLAVISHDALSLYPLENFSASLALMIDLVCRVRVPGREHRKFVLQRWQVHHKHGMAAASEGASLLWGRGNCRHLQLPVHEELRVSSASSLHLSKHCTLSFSLHGLLQFQHFEQSLFACSMLTGHWWMCVCCETRCTNKQCWCTDGPDQKRSPDAGTEYADQIKKGIIKAGKAGKCSCSCGGVLS